MWTHIKILFFYAAALFNMVYSFAIAVVGENYSKGTWFLLCSFVCYYAGETELRKLKESL